MKPVLSELNPDRGTGNKSFQSPLAFMGDDTRNSKDARAKAMKYFETRFAETTVAARLGI